MEQSSTALQLENSYDFNHLKGDLVNIWPFVHGHFARDLPYQIWSAMEKEDAIKLVFYENKQQTTPVSTNADLAYFTKFFSDPDKILLLVTSTDGEDLAGLIWFDNVIPYYRANCSYWFKRKYWGNPVREACYRGMDYCFNFLGFQALWGFTPWRTSLKTTNSLGWSLVATLPKYTLSFGKERDLYVSMMKRENYKYGWRQ